MEKPSAFIVHSDGSITVDYWPDHQRIDARFIESADPQYLNRDGDLVVFSVSNGEAAYRLGELGSDGVYEATKVYAEWAWVGERLFRKDA